MVCTAVFRACGCWLYSARWSLYKGGCATPSIVSIQPILLWLPGLCRLNSDCRDGLWVHTSSCNKWTAVIASFSIYFTLVLVELVLHHSMFISSTHSVLLLSFHFKEKKNSWAAVTLATRWGTETDVRRFTTTRMFQSRKCYLNRLLALRDVLLCVFLRWFDFIPQYFIYISKSKINGCYGKLGTVCIFPLCCV